jgi:hypothetical protein
MFLLPLDLAEFRCQQGIKRRANFSFYEISAISATQQGAGARKGEPPLGNFR